jgi:DNA-directed RNA polymerase subunit M/transcription elongation factor TFIIS
MSNFPGIVEFKTLETILKEYTDLNDEQINVLIKISRKGYPILDIYRSYDFVYEIIGLLKKNSYDKVYDFLVSLSKLNTPINSASIYSFYTYDKLNAEYEADISKIRDRIEIKNSDTPCKKCGSKNVFSTSKQTRSGDEPETNIYVCNDCGKTWRD